MVIFNNILNNRNGQLNDSERAAWLCHAVLLPGADTNNRDHRQDLQEPD